MKEKIEILLMEAEFYRNGRNYSNALANLHQVVKAYPDNLNYQYLLAATYLEAGNMEAAKETAQHIVETDTDQKRSLELLGAIAIEEKQYAEAETFFKKALALDADFHSARQNLIKLYDEHLRNDPEMELHCKYMLEHRDPDRETYSMKKKNQVSWDWLIYVYSRLEKALGCQHKFEEAIKYTREDMAFAISTHRKKADPMMLICFYGDLYTFYYRMGNEEALEKYKEEYKSIYTTRISDYEEDFRFKEECALERYP